MQRETGNRAPNPKSYPGRNPPGTAAMDRWLVIDFRGQRCLFGFATSHPRTGGRSWTKSSAIVELDEASGSARTASGRLYLLGRRIDQEELDEEGRLAMDILVRGIDDVLLGPCDLLWLMACKRARHLGQEPPARMDCPAVERFVAASENRYLAALFGSIRA